MFIVYHLILRLSPHFAISDRHARNLHGVDVVVDIRTQVTVGIVLLLLLGVVLLLLLLVVVVVVVDIIDDRCIGRRHRLSRLDRAQLCRSECVGELGQRQRIAAQH